MNEITIQDIAKFLINPLLPLVLLLCILALRRKPRRALTVAAFIFLYLASTSFIPNLFFSLWKIPDTVDFSKTYDVVIPMTGIAEYKWYAEDRYAFPSFTCYYRFGSHSERVLRAAELLRQGHASRLLFGEMIRKSFNEGLLIKEFLIQQGFPADRVMLYGEVKNTLDEAVKIREYTRAHGWERIILVTSASHMRRAAAMFRKQGMDPALLSVEQGRYTPSWGDFIPGRNGLGDTENMLYELVAYIAYALLGKI